VQDNDNDDLRGSVPMRLRRLSAAEQRSTGAWQYGRRGPLLRFLSRWPPKSGAKNQIYGAQ